MSWVKQAFTSSIGKKIVMSVTGLFLVIFLVAHLAGNVALLSKDPAKFNEYAHFMKHNPLIAASEIILFLGFIFHIVQGLMLEKQNRSARSQGYAIPHKNDKVSWTSKYMGPFGIVILLFLLLHLWDFFRFKYFCNPGNMPGTDIADLYSIVHNVYSSSIIHVIIYPLAMFVIGLHLSHGFQSAFQSLGINHVKYNGLIKGIGTAYAVIIPALFALIPIMIYVGCLPL